jgi:diacylglycerol kinase
MNWVFLIAFAIAGLRVAGVKDAAFQAVAHLFVGAAFGAALCAQKRAHHLDLWSIFVLLCLVELFCFFSSDSRSWRGPIIPESNSGGRT